MGLWFEWVLDLSMWFVVRLERSCGSSGFSDRSHTHAGTLHMVCLDQGGRWLFLRPHAEGQHNLSTCLIGRIVAQADSLMTLCFCQGRSRRGVGWFFVGVDSNPGFERLRLYTGVQTAVWSLA